MPGVQRESMVPAEAGKLGSSGRQKSGKTRRKAKNPGYMFSTTNGGVNRVYNNSSLPSNRPSSSEMLLLMNRKLIFECPAPFISASSWIIMDKTNCEVLFARNENESRQVASLTKIMTAYVIFNL
jgi:hypothetical protein